jgi:N-acetylmuramoyl-L-alanine amidase
MLVQWLKENNPGKFTANDYFVTGSEITIPDGEFSVVRIIGYELPGVAVSDGEIEVDGNWPEFSNPEWLEDGEPKGKMARGRTVTLHCEVRHLDDGETVRFSIYRGEGENPVAETEAEVAGGHVRAEWVVDAGDGDTGDTEDEGSGAPPELTFVAEHGGVAGSVSPILEVVENQLEFSNLEWRMGGEQIGEAALRRTVTLHCDVENLDDGETVTFDIYRNDEEAPFAGVEAEVAGGHAEAEWEVAFGGGDENPEAQAPGSSELVFTVRHGEVVSDPGPTLEVGNRSEFLIAIDPGHFVGTGDRRTPQMPNLVLNNNGNLEPNWDGLTSRLRVNPQRPIENGSATPTITTPEGVVDIFLPDGVTTPSGWNVSADRDNPAHGVVDGVPARERIQMREWEFNNDVAVRLIALLEDRGYSVLNVAPQDDPRMTGAEASEIDHRISNGVGNPRRTSRANNYGLDATTFNTFGRQANFYLSIHANAAPFPANEFSQPNGIETFFQPLSVSTSAVSQRCAAIIHDRLIGMGRGYGQSDRHLTAGFRSLDVHVLTATRMAAVLTESAFFTNFREAILLMDDTFRQRTAQALSDAIDEIYGLWRDNPESFRRD